MSQISDLSFSLKKLDTEEQIKLKVSWRDTDQHAEQENNRENQWKKKPVFW